MAGRSCDSLATIKDEPHEQGTDRGGDYVDEQVNRVASATGNEQLVKLIGCSINGSKHNGAQNDTSQGYLQTQRIGQQDAEDEIFPEMSDGRRVDRLTGNARKHIAQPTLHERKQPRTRIEIEPALCACHEDHDRPRNNQGPGNDLFLTAMLGRDNAHAGRITLALPKML